MKYFSEYLGAFIFRGRSRESQPLRIRVQIWHDIAELWILKSKMGISV